MVTDRVQLSPIRPLLWGISPLKIRSIHVLLWLMLPSNSVYYGNLVAGPVFKEISDKVYAKYFYRFQDGLKMRIIQRRKNILRFLK